jgi:hypothetical protein
LSKSHWRKGCLQGDCPKQEAKQAGNPALSRDELTPWPLGTPPSTDLSEPQLVYLYNGHESLLPQLPAGFMERMDRKRFTSN